MLRPLVFAVFVASTTIAQSPSLQTQLGEMSSQDIASGAMSRGDAMRGAILFHQTHMRCAKCHTVTKKQSLLGPNLVVWEKEVDRAYLIESILNPSRKIRDGYQTVIAVTDEGQQQSGILVSQDADFLVMRDASGDGRDTKLAKRDLETVLVSKQSIMPEGLINQLASVDQFFDLARYVIEVAEQGPERAAQLQPPSLLTQLPPLPEYESHIDHAGMIDDFGEESFKRGQRIYNRVCANCHGTHHRDGSLPTAAKFASGKLKNGHDPFRLYQTLTHGHGQMVAQRWMVPQQKYDVINYIRVAYFESNNPNLYVKVDGKYLESLPPGNTRGPDPQRFEKYVAMDYGPSMNHTFEITLNNSGEDIGWDLGRSSRASKPWANPDEYFPPGQAPNFAYKGIAIRLDQGPGGISRGTHWIVYDHDTMNVQAAWSGSSYIDYSCVQFDGKHACHNRLTGKIHFENPVGPGWGQPLTGVFYDPRPVGRDGRPYGPLPVSWGAYQGLYHHGQKAILSYRIGNTEVLESPSVIQAGGVSIFVRKLSIGGAAHKMRLRLAPLGNHAKVVGTEHADVIEIDGYLVMLLEQREQPVHLKVLVSDQPIDREMPVEEPVDLAQFTHGAAPRWPDRVKTPVNTVHDDVFAVDEMTLPSTNPWNAQVRPTGHDFFSDYRRAAVCTWDGDVWIVDGVDQDEGELTWQRIASGLFQPLGLKILDEQIFVTCRDQLVVLRDLNGDNETDFYQCFNNDHQVTEHFHEFAMGLQTDDAGNFYYAKSGRHDKRAVVPHHGTLLKISSDGKKTEILATGFRAANGVCLNPDGSFFVTDQEGHWIPKNRINWVTKGGFYGNLYGFTEIVDPSDDAMLLPLCWITNNFDRSPAELLWVPKHTWGPFGGALLSLSYGYGKVFIVPHERVNGQLQGGMCQLPIPDFPSGLVRGRFHPERGDLYVCGMFSWSGNRQAPGCFHRIRYAGKPAHLPMELKAKYQGVEVIFSHPLSHKSAMNVDNYQIEAWDLRRTPAYGSKHFNQREWTIESATLGADNKTVTLTIPRLAPTWGMSIKYQLEGENGRKFDGLIHNSIFNLPPSENQSSQR